MKKCIFFPLIGDYDYFREPKVISPNWDYICFTNNKKLKSKNIEIRYVKKDEDLSNVKFSRKIYILNHKFVGDYDLSISMIASMKVLVDPDVFLKSLRQDDKIDMYISKHPKRDCIYKEAKQCIKLEKDDPKIIRKQIEMYKKEGYPENNGLAACGLMIRKHGRSNLEEHCERWWNIVKNYSTRDQLSFNYILWKYNLINLEYFPFKVITGNKYFKKFPHKK